MRVSGYGGKRGIGVSGKSGYQAIHTFVPSCLCGSRGVKKIFRNPVVTTIDNSYRGPYNIACLSARKKVILGARRVIHETRLKTLLRRSLWTPRS